MTVVIIIMSLCCFYLFQVSESPIAVNCIENPSTFPTNSSHTKVLTSHNITYTSNKEVYSSISPEKVNMDLAGGVDDKDNIVHVSICQIRIQTKQKLVMKINRFNVVKVLTNSWRGSK